MTTTDSTTLARPATRSLAIVPLRVFLGATFVDAGLGKLLSAAYLGTGPRGFAAQARGFARGSPIGWLVRAVALPHPMAAGLLLAVAELAIGLLTLVGLASRAAAAGGLALSFTFFLTASWHTRPFFYGPDLPFAAGWLVLLLAGHAGLPSLDRRLARRQRVLAGLGDDREVAVPLDRVQQVCADAGRQGRCPGAIGRTCRGEQCPLTPRPAGPVAFDASRRALLVRGALAAVALTVTGVVGGGVAAAERLLGGDADGGGGLASLPSQPTPPTPPTPRAAPPPSPARPAPRCPRSPCTSPATAASTCRTPARRRRLGSRTPDRRGRSRGAPGHDRPPPRRPVTVTRRLSNGRPVTGSIARKAPWNSGFARRRRAGARLRRPGAPSARPRRRAG